ncbi:hypothetical protein CLV59_10129 [Chitinophaga dinghuensis]|uniref:GIY-YIG domain-containing protein n=1 Tax=Chitinophaga dinghuensis TaxID=1539050 RepID=A0A327WD46_9BACT|nr:DNA/RNA helicase domain-containing protein [Chitinophaga dinghuensis]RAJ87280.1 hypothetical protein CLV59_10129 [Chitinophaga dinghuensis]
MIDIHPFRFNADILTDVHSVTHYLKENWPVVYILVNNKTKEIYIGETTKLLQRLDDHLKDDRFRTMERIYVITSARFNKSLTWNIEVDLISYIGSEGVFKPINWNSGNKNRNYQHKVADYDALFEDVWNKLRGVKIAKSRLKDLTNSDLFKYSPYKELSEDQIEGLIKIIQSLLNKDANTVFIDGGAGTGKTLLAIFLFKLLHTQMQDFNFLGFGKYQDQMKSLVTELHLQYPNPSAALVVPVSSFRKTVEKVFAKVTDLEKKMVVAPIAVTRQQYDIIMVDESHRLRRYNVLGAYAGNFKAGCLSLEMDHHTNTELDWVKAQSKKLILLYDAGQSIRPSDVRKRDFDKLKVAKGTVQQQLKSQLRVRGGISYVNHVKKLIGGKLKTGDPIYKSSTYSLLLFDSLEHMLDEIKQRDKEYGLARMVAGYAWEWNTKKKGKTKPKAKYDIIIGNVKLKWNGTPKEWINSKNAINEVGCIHTTQGYDLNYTGVIFGNEISYDKRSGKIITRKENYHDKNGKTGLETDEEVHEYICRIYDTLMKRGIRGTYIYVCDPELKNYFDQFIVKAKNRKTIPLIISDNTSIPENAVRYYDIDVAAGDFSSPRLSGDNKWIQLPSHLKASENLFACKVVGESMNMTIKNGSICLFAKDEGGSRNGEIVLASHANIQDKDLGFGHTVKEYLSKKKTGEDSWEHEEIILRPNSDDPSFTDIVLANDELVDLKIMGIFKEVLYEPPYSF